jgi:hypothetical protein
LKLKYDEPLSKFAFVFNLRHYTSETPASTSMLQPGLSRESKAGEAAVAVAGAAKAPPRGLQPQHEALRGRHILYAEDSVPSQMIVKRMLDRAGVQVTVRRCS